MPSGLRFSTSSAGVCRRHDGDAPAAVNEVAKDVGLDSEVVRDDVAIARLRSRKTGKLDELQRLL